MNLPRPMPPDRPHRCIPQALVLAIALGSLPPADASPLDGRIRVTGGHVDVRAVLGPSLASPVVLVADDEEAGVRHPADAVAFVVPESARLEVPEGFPELGPAGSPLWALQQGSVDGQPLVGLSSEELPPELFQPTVRFHLRQASGPGHFLGWQATDLGVVRVAFNTRDGITDDDTLVSLLDSHEHLNWGFTAPGLYELTLQVELVGVGGLLPVLSEPTRFLFAVEPLPALTPFEAWQASQFPGVTDSQVRGPTADPDADGSPNLAEFFLGTDPNQPAALQRVQVAFDASGRCMLSYTTPAVRRDQVRPTVVPRDTLGGPDDAPLADPVVEAVPTPAGEAGEWIRWTFTDPASSAHPRRFYGLRLELR